MPNSLKRAVIKEELVKLTGDYKKAVILNQFIYWSERVNDFDEFIEEENKRKNFDEELELRQGWIFKSAKELAKETMLDLSPATMRKHIKVLRDKGWIKERNNPNYEWDHTKQYRVEIQKIQQDLLKIGYSLDNYSIDLDKLPILETKNRSEETKNRDQKNEGTIPETTSETTNREKTYKDDINQIIKVYKEKSTKHDALIHHTKPVIKKGKGYIRTRLKNGYSVDRCIDAIKGVPEAYNSDRSWWSRQRTLETLFHTKKGEYVEQFAKWHHEEYTDSGLEEDNYDKSKDKDYVKTLN